MPLHLPRFLGGFAVVAGLVLGAAAASADIAAPSVRVARFAGDRPAAVSYTFDDGLRDHATHAAPYLDEAGFKGTFFIIPGRVSPDVADAEKRKFDKRAWGTVTWDEWRQIAARGHEIGSHSWSHPGLAKLPLAEAEAQMTRASDAIRTELGRAPLTFAFPFNQSTPELQAVALRHHVAFRSRQLGVGGEKTTVASLSAWTDKLVRDRAWGIVMAHGIAYGYAAFTDPEIFRSHLAEMRRRQSEVWVDTFANVARYERERDAAAVSVLASAPGRLVLTLSADLDPAIFDVPLTLIVSIRSTAITRAERSGRELPIRIGQDSVQIDAPPAADPITLIWQ